MGRGPKGVEGKMGGEAEDLGVAPREPQEHLVLLLQTQLPLRERAKALPTNPLVLLLPIHLLTLDSA